MVRKPNICTCLPCDQSLSALHNLVILTIEQTILWYVLACAKDHILFLFDYPQINEVGKADFMTGLMQLSKHFEFVDRRGVCGSFMRAT